MYAVIKTGGKQYKVENEQKILVDRINADEGSIVTLSDLLMVVDSGKISQGKDLQNMAVSATVVKQTRGPKIITLKHRRRKNSRRVKGHKQDLTLLKVVGIGDPKKLVIKDQKKSN
jgi:large subunit ribosomal protein L21